MKIFKYIVPLIIVCITVSCNTKTHADDTKVVTTTVNGITTSVFKVWGNCDMCKETIENSLKINGVVSSDWNTESKMITVSFDSTKINLNQIQKNIASVGYDNVKYTADDQVYNELHDCCKYDRKQ